MKSFFHKNRGNLLLLALLALILIPQTGMPIKVFFNRLIAFSPAEISTDKRKELDDYGWKLTSLEGENTDLSLSEGRVMLVNSWATWCPPCVAELPSLQSLYDQYGDKVDFYFVSNEPEEKLKRFLSKKGYDIPVYRIRSQPPAMLNSNALPTTWVISASGEIVVEKSGAAKWDGESTIKLLERLLSAGN